jgi:hypothetical protein
MARRKPTAHQLAELKADAQRARAADAFADDETGACDLGIWGCWDGLTLGSCQALGAKRGLPVNWFPNETCDEVHHLQPF